VKMLLEYMQFLLFVCLPSLPSLGEVRGKKTLLSAVKFVPFV
jgi:hypothetical protein